MKTALSVASVSLIIMATFVWAAADRRAAHNRFRHAVDRDSAETQTLSWQGQTSSVRRSQTAIPGTVRLRNVSGRGLVVSTWINGAGSFEFAVDTGVGTTLVSSRVASQAGLPQGRGVPIQIGGLSGAAGANGRDSIAQSVAIGGPENVLPSKLKVIVTNSLPAGIDGVLDPADAFWPLGFGIDMLRSEISAFDPKVAPIRVSDAPQDGVVVPWLLDGQTRRPFVMLDNGYRALLDTGSAFGFAISEKAAHQTGLLNIDADENGPVQDITGRNIASRRVAPATIRIGSLSLRRIPTDILSGVEADAPILLGREALRPFHLAFDPLHRLIMIAPSSGGR